MGKLPFPRMPDGMPIRFKYKSPLALVLGQQEVARLTQYIQTMQGIMGPDAAQIYINPKTTPYMLAKALQINTDYLNKPENVAETMQNLQDKHNAQLANAQAETPQQPTNPSEQIAAPGGGA